jgi:uncharacterized SAM-binding protein YcdF (DUF218 family)
VSLLWVKEFVKSFLLPPAGLLLLALAGFAISRRNAVLGFRLTLLSVVLLSLLAMPAVSGLLVWTLDRSPPLDLITARSAQAIVILGGGVRASAPEYGGPTVSAITLARVRYGAWLARATHLPVLLSGGAVRRGPPEALLMREVLTREFGVPVRWLEVRSRNTHENAIESARILFRDHVYRVILVGQRFDFPRARKEFEAAGMQVITAAIDIPRPWPEEFEDFVPTARGLLESYYACYEILANVLFDVTHAFAPTPAPAARTPEVDPPIT